MINLFYRGVAAKNRDAPVFAVNNRDIYVIRQIFYQIYYKN